MKYAVYMDDGAHTNEVDVFTSLKGNKGVRC